MSELNSEKNNEKTKKSSAKKTFLGLTIFTIICIIITCFCITMTIKNKNTKEEISYEEKLETSKNTDSKENKEPIKNAISLTDKAFENKLEVEEIVENYGDLVESYQLDTEVKKLEVRYIKIDGLKNSKVEDSINEAIKNKVYEVKDKLMEEIDNEDVERMTITATVTANFSDVLSVSVYNYILYGYNDTDYSNDKYINGATGLNFSLIDGKTINFDDMFLEGSPIKTILSQGVYDAIAWDYAFDEDDAEWDWDMDNLDYSGIESKVYNFLYKYNKDPNLDFYFTSSNIEIIKNTESAETYSIPMENFYEYIAIYSKYSSENLYEDDSKKDEFYVFGAEIIADSLYEEETKGNVYYSKYCYSTSSSEEQDEKLNEVDSYARKELDKKIEEYIQELSKNAENGYIIEAYYSTSNYQNKYGYNFEISISECSIDYFNNHLEEALAKGSREDRVDIAPLNYCYIIPEEFR